MQTITTLYVIDAVEAKNGTQDEKKAPKGAALDKRK
jgi:hypothetical protein